MGVVLVGWSGWTRMAGQGRILPGWPQGQSFTGITPVEQRFLGQHLFTHSKGRLQPLPQLSGKECTRRESKSISEIKLETTLWSPGALLDSWLFYWGWQIPNRGGGKSKDWGWLNKEEVLSTFQGGEGDYQDILGLLLPHSTEWWQSAFHRDLRIQDNYTSDCSN